MNKDKLLIELQNCNDDSDVNSLAESLYFSKNNVDETGNKKFSQEQIKTLLQSIYAANKKTVLQR